MEFSNILMSLLDSTGIYHFTVAQAIMIAVGILLLWLGIVKKFEPLLLLPIGFGGILANIPLAGIADLSNSVISTSNIISNLPAITHLPLAELLINNTSVTTEFGGFLGQIYGFGIASGLFPLLIFMGVGAMTDFGPLIANPKTALLGGAQQQFFYLRDYRHIF